MSDSNAFRMPPHVAFTMYSGDRFFELADADTPDTSLHISSERDRLAQISGFSFRMFTTRAQLRELRDLLNRASLGVCDDKEYDVAYAATVRAWEAIGVS